MNHAGIFGGELGHKNIYSGMNTHRCVEYKRLDITWPAPLIERIDNARGDVPRSTWIRRSVEKTLGIKIEDRQEDRLERFGIKFKI